MPLTKSSSSSKQSAKSHRKTPSNASRSSTALPKTEVVINVYDLLPPGRLSSILWTIGSSLLHSGVVINDREYAYGGHNKSGVTGVYWTQPHLEPPGGTFRASILHGFTFRSEAEIKSIIKEVSNIFLGPTYHLLSNNCNHFTSALCERLTLKSAPAYLNRAASIGLALPCIIPREWGIAPPDHETAEGELLEVSRRDTTTTPKHNDDDDEYASSDDNIPSSSNDDDDDDDADEHAGMMDRERRRQRRASQRLAQRRNSATAPAAATTTTTYEQGNSLAGGQRIQNSADELPARFVKTRDSGGTVLPVSERAPVPGSVGRKS